MPVLDAPVLPVPVEPLSLPLDAVDDDVVLLLLDALDVEAVLLPLLLALEELDDAEVLLLDDALELPLDALALEADVPPLLPVADAEAELLVAPLLDEPCVCAEVEPVPGWMGSTLFKQPASAREPNPRSHFIAHLAEGHSLLVARAEQGRSSMRFLQHACR